MKTKVPPRPAARRRPAKPRSLDAWERGWQQYWRRRGTCTYELPSAGPGREESEFLTQARTLAGERTRLKRIQREFEAGFAALQNLGPAVTVFGSARFKEDHEYYKLARAVGAELARSGFTVLTGGGAGIMEAANRGASESGGNSIGLNIILPHEQCINPYVNKSVEFHYFFVRKVMLVKYSCAFIVMPGGLGTLDELYEAATLIQCQKIGPFPIITMGEKFWRGLRRFSADMVRAGVFGAEEVGFARTTDSPREAVRLIAATLPPSVRSYLKPAN